MLLFATFLGVLPLSNDISYLRTCFMDQDSSVGRSAFWRTAFCFNRDPSGWYKASGASSPEHCTPGTDIRCLGRSLTRDMSNACAALQYSPFFILSFYCRTKGRIGNLQVPTQSIMQCHQFRAATDLLSSVRH